LIGANSSGKTSILEIIGLLKNMNSVVDSAHFVTGKLDNDESKTIEFIFSLELLESEQRKFYHYLKLPDEEAIRTIMKRVRLTFSMNVTRNPKFEVENRLLVTGMEISDTDNQSFIPILTLKNPDRMIIEKSEFNENLLNIGRIANNPVVNDNLRNAAKTAKNASSHYASKPNSSLWYDFVQYFLSRIRYVPSFRKSNKMVTSKFIESEDSVTDLDGDIIQFMDTLHSNNNKRFQEISNICKNIF